MAHQLFEAISASPVFVRVSSRLHYLLWFTEKKNNNDAIYLSVNVLSTKVLTDGTTFTSPTGDWTDNHFFSQLFLSTCPSPGIEPSTFHSVVKCSTD